MTLVIDAARDLKHLPDRPCKDKALHTKLISGEAWKRTEKCLKNVRCRLSAHFLREEHEKALTKVSQLEKQLVQKDKVFEQVLKREGKVFNVALQAKEQECSLKLQANEQQFRQELPAKEHDLVEWRAARGRMVRIGNNRQAEDGGAAKRARARVEAAASGTAGRCRTGAAPKKAQHLNMHRT